MADQPRDPAPTQELIGRLREIESQPLAERASEYAALHDELARRLEAGPVDSSA